MAVQAASLEMLEKANVPAPQARAIVQAIEIELAGARDTLATKQDFWELKAGFAGLRSDVESRIERLGNDVESRIEGLGNDVNSRIEGLRNDVESRITGLRSDIESRIVGLRGDIESKIIGLRSGVEVNMATLEGRLRAEIHLAVSGSTRQMYGALLAQMAVLLGIVYFLAAHLPR